MLATTNDLLKRALNAKTAATWCKQLNISTATIAQAKKRGRLSPVLAGNIAIDLGEDAHHWITVATLETERESPLSERLREKLKRQKQ